MHVLTKIATSLVIFTSLVVVIGLVGNGFRLPWRQDQLAEQIQILSKQLDTWKVPSHEGRITAIEKDVGNLVSGQEEQRKATGALKDSIQVVGQNVAVGLVEIRSVVSGMVSGVENAQRIAIRAEEMVVDRKVVKDFRENSVQPQPQFGK